MAAMQPVIKRRPASTPGALYQARSVGLVPLKFLLLTATAWILCTGCEGPMPGRFSRLSGNYPPKPKDYSVEVLDHNPTRPFEEIARLDVHTEHGFFDEPTLKQVMPELLKQARLAGADAIINIQERKATLNETKVLHVTATAIRYKDQP